jgi:hypothetical protein
MSKIHQGFNVVGVLQGIAEDGHYKSIGVSVSSKNKFGQSESQTTEINLGQDAFNRLVDDIKQHTGKQVIINVAVVMRKSPRTNNYYQSIFCHRDTEVQVLAPLGAARAA